MLKIFLSSTAKDLVPYRDAVTRAIHFLDDCHCVRMEDFGSRSAKALGFCQEKVQECDIFVGIIGSRYGSNPDDSPISYTEHEYEAAVTKGMPRFLFLSSPEIPSKDSQETSEQKQAQERFRRRAANEQIVGTFMNPEGLAASVTAAISNWLLQAARLPAAERDQPGLGPLVVKMCDRSAEEATFKMFFNAKIREAPGVPQVCILRGRESERADSLVERMTATIVQLYATVTFGEQHGTVLTNSVEWPHEGELPHRLELLRANIFKEFDPTYEFRCEDFSSAALARLTSSKLHPVIVLYHEIRANRWVADESRLIAEYLKYWDEFSALSARVQVLVFLNIIYPDEAARRPWWKSVLGGAFDAGKVERDVLAVLNQRQAASRPGNEGLAPCLLLKELSSICQDDVMQWFKRHRIFDDMKIWQEKCRRIFEANAARSMAEIEFALKSIHREFLNSKL